MRPTKFCLSGFKLIKTIEVMSKPPKRTPAQYNKGLFQEISTTEFRETKDNTWFKVATVKVAEFRSRPNHGKRGCGVLSVVNEFNKNLSLSNEKMI